MAVRIRFADPSRSHLAVSIERMDDGLLYDFPYNPTPAAQKALEHPQEMREDPLPPLPPPQAQNAPSGALTTLPSVSQNIDYYYVDHPGSFSTIPNTPLQRLTPAAFPYTGRHTMTIKNTPRTVFKDGEYCVNVHDLQANGVKRCRWVS